MQNMVHDEYLVWTEIAMAFRRLLDAWWEQPEEILEGIRSFARSLFGPLAEKLGFVHLPNDETDARLFRVLVLAAAAAAEVPEYAFTPLSYSLVPDLSPPQGRRASSTLVRPPRFRSR